VLKEARRRLVNPEANWQSFDIVLLSEQTGTSFGQAPDVGTGPRPHATDAPLQMGDQP
jgi:hypothetical protein